MEGKEKLTEGFEEAFGILKTNLIESFEYMQEHPGEQDEVIDEWKGYLRKFVTEATGMSEKYNNRNLLKAISKMFIFGR